MIMGKRGPKPQFTDVACPNEDCDLYGQTGQENVVGNGTYEILGKFGIPNLIYFYLQVRNYI